MQTWRKFTRALTAAVAIGAISTAGWAAAPTECGLIGSWVGADAGSDLVWLGVHTAGSTNTRGEMLMDWVTNNMVFVSSARMTPGRGVWEQTGKGQYKYTWYAFVIDDGVGGTGKTYRVIVSGTAANTDCDNIAIKYRFRLYDDSISNTDPIYVTPTMDRDPGNASETRLPLTP